MLSADYYDGKSTRRHRVTLQAVPGVLWIAGDGVDRHAALERLSISEHLGAAPRLIRFADGAFCEVREHAGLDDLLQRAGHRRSRVERAQLSWAIALASVAVVLALAVASYLWGLPWISARVAERMPAQVSMVLTRSTLETLDSGPWLEPSALSSARRRELEQGLDRLKAPDGGALPPHRLLFRSSPAFGANAMALPDGSILLLDELVKLADNDEQIDAVLAHELGHVRHQHGLKMLLQGTLVGAFTAWWYGDFSGMLVAGPSALLQSRYSRGFETEADAYGAALLRANGLSTVRMAEMLEKLVQAHAIRHDQNSKQQTTQDTKDDPRNPWLDYLSSHPATEARIKAFRDGTL